MALTFYICSFIAIVAAMLIIICNNPMYALLYLIILLTAIAGIFFSFGAYFVGALEIIICVGAITVMFIFVVMILNTNEIKVKQSYRLFKSKTWIGPVVLSAIMLTIIIYSILKITDLYVYVIPIDIKTLGIILFGGPYILIVESISMLLLASLIISFHIGRKDNFFNINLNDNSNNIPKKEIKGKL